METTNGTARLTYTPDGLLTIIGDNRDAPLSGAVLLRIRFRGLTTGKPENRVACGKATFDRIGEATVAGDGLIRLDGTSEGIGIAERVRIISVQSLGDVIVVTWRAAQGVRPALRLFDGTGRMVTRTVPGEATGEEQVFSLAASELAHGWYLLELRDGDICATATAMRTQ
jgi:hypothetical protein